MSRRVNYKHRKQLHSTNNSCKAPRVGSCGRLFDTNHLPIALAAHRQSNTVIGVGCAHVEALVPQSCSCSYDSCRTCCIAWYGMCEGLCGGRHQEDPLTDNVALFGGAHVRKGSGICCCIHDTLMNMHLQVPVYLLYMGTLNLRRY